jgi:hypothetical protein
MPIFAFFDESGEYTYHSKSGKYLVFTGIVTATPALFSHEFACLKYDLLQHGHCVERFHASEDKQFVRDRVFKIIADSSEYAIHSIVVRKNKVHPSLHKYGVYSVAYRTLLKYLVGAGGVQQIHIVVDTVPDKYQEAAMKVNLKLRAEEVLSPLKIPFSLDHHSSHSHALLQVADYCAWAIQKKWQAQDVRSYDLIQNKIRNEFDIYAKGIMDFY